VRNTLSVFVGLSSGIIVIGCFLGRLGVHQMWLVGTPIHTMECQSPQTVPLRLCADFGQRRAVPFKHLPYRLPVFTKLELDCKRFKVMLAVRQRISSAPPVVVNLLLSHVHWHYIGQIPERGWFLTHSRSVHY
jgi:hypothetical protein